MRVLALKYLGGTCVFLLRKCLKAATDGASFTSFGRLFVARIDEGKKESKNIYVITVVLNVFRISKGIPGCFLNSSRDRIKEALWCKTV